jgi:metal-responsive CopG/Arc/MetJ family transcriptional regulator
MSREAVIKIRLPEDLFRDIGRISQEQNRELDQVIAEALRQYARNAQWAKLQGELSARARDLGITTEDDVEEIVDEIRRKS